MPSVMGGAMDIEAKQIPRGQTQKFAHERVETLATMARAGGTFGMCYILAIWVIAGGFVYIGSIDSPCHNLLRLFCFLEGGLLFCMSCSMSGFLCSIGHAAGNIDDESMEDFIHGERDNDLEAKARAGGQIESAMKSVGVAGGVMYASIIAMGCCNWCIVIGSWVAFFITEFDTCKPPPPALNSSSAVQPAGALTTPAAVLPGVVSTTASPQMDLGMYWLVWSLLSGFIAMVMIRCGFCCAKRQFERDQASLAASSDDDSDS